MEEQYARALFTLIEGGMQPKKAVDSLKDLLDRQGRTALMSRIGRAFARIATREARKNDVTLTVVHQKDKDSAHREIKKLLDEMNVESKDVETRVDDSLIGGWRLEGRGNLVDNSFKKHLLSIYNRATQ